MRGSVTFRDKTKEDQQLSLRHLRKLVMNRKHNEDKRERLAEKARQKSTSELFTAINSLRELA